MIIRFLFLALILPCFHLLAASPEVFDLHRATEQDTATTFSLIGRDDDGDELTYSIVTEPSHGSVSINGNQVTYTPKANSNYTETFTYKATDGVSNSEVGIINMAVFTGYRDIAQQLGQDIDGEAARDESGYSVSMSADGQTVAIGAILNDDNRESSGHVRIYTFNSGEWRRLGQDIDGEAAGDLSGYSVSMSADGRTVAIGAPANDGDGIASGHVRIYTFNNNEWQQLGQDIDGEVADHFYGMPHSISVSISADGRTVAVGAPYNDGNGMDSGHVRIYSFDGNEWRQLGQDIDGEAVADYSGWSVSMSADGRTLAIGAWGNGAYANGGGDLGLVRIYTFNSGEWQQLGQDINGEAGGDRSGHSVSMSADGQTVAIGAILNDDNRESSGHVRIYTFNGSAWQQIGQDIDGEAVSDYSGTSVSMSADGRTVAIGARSNDGNGERSGHARIYTFNGSSWQQIAQDIDGEAVADNSGWSVSMSADGRTVAVGAPYNDDNGIDSGHVQIYRLVNSAPVTEAQSIILYEGSAVDITLLATDADGDTLSYTVNAIDAEKGSLVLKAGFESTYTYTPAQYYNTDFTFEYTVTDGNGGGAVGVVYVSIIPIDRAAPLITITGSSNVNIELGQSYVDAGATAIDSVDGVVAVTSSGSVDVNTLGVYTITYNAVDSAGNSATPVSRTINVVDSTPPSIALIGSDVVNIALGSNYVDAGATATDAVDGIVNVTTSGTVDTDTIGAYTIVYNAVDLAGNIATQVTRRINVIDSAAPLITITGYSNVNIELGQSYVDAGATAIDSVDGVVAVTSRGSVDVNTLGVYTITYSAVDSAGNSATPVTRTINVIPVTDSGPVLIDTDGDGMPDSCDSACIALGMSADLDDDNDGYSDEYELSVGSDPLDGDILPINSLDITIIQAVLMKNKTTPTTQSTDNKE